MPNFFRRNVISRADRIIRGFSLLKEISPTLLTREVDGFQHKKRHNKKTKQNNTRHVIGITRS